MSDHRNFARTVLAASSVVIAASAAAVALKVVQADLGAAQPPRLMDPGSLERRIAHQVQGYEDTPLTRVNCPASIEVKVGSQFTCRFWDGRMGEVPVTITTDQGDIDLGTPTRF